jgi:heavy metal sensor kinase
MTLWRSLEFRLAAWYSFLLFAGLSCLGAALWFGVNYSMVEAVDDVLAARIERLSRYLEAEFGHQFLDPLEKPSHGRLLGEIERVDPNRAWIVIHGVKTRVTPDTEILGSARPEALRVGQYAIARVQRDGDEWIASEIVEDEEFQQELQKELYEYAISLPEGDLTEMRTVTGQILLSPSARNESQALIPWQDTLAPSDSQPRTLELEAGLFRVLNGTVQLASGSYRIQVASSLAPVTATQQRLLSWLLWAVPPGLLLSLCGGYFISRRALRPVEEIVNVASRIDVDRLSVRLNVPSTGDVVERLASTFNAMLERLHGSVNRLEQFTADASHELRSPVSVIRTTAELALRQGRTQEEFRGDMLEIHEEATSLTNLIDDLLTLSRADGHADRLPLSDVDLGTVAREVAEQFGRTMPQRKFSVEIDKGMVLTGHAPSLRRLLVILLDNALEHTPADASIRVAVHDEADALVLSVADTGEGIPPEHLNRVFDRFYRIDSSRSRFGGGFGLGLSIAKWIVESHGGKIGVMSEVGKGTTFIARLPRQFRPAAVSAP